MICVIARIAFQIEDFNPFSGSFQWRDVPRGKPIYVKVTKKILAAAVLAVGLAMTACAPAAETGTTPNDGSSAAVPIVTGLSDVATYGAFGQAGENISFLNHYFPGAADNDIEAP